MRPHLACFASLIVTAVLAVPASAQRVVILVRHAEKAADTGDPPLSETGKKRAEDLAARLKDTGATAIFTSTAARTKLTAQPLAASLHLTPTVRPDNETPAMFAAYLAATHPDGVVLIVGHSNTVPPIIDALLKRDSGVQIGENEYDHLFVLVHKGDGSWGLVRARY